MTSIAFAKILFARFRVSELASLLVLMFALPACATPESADFRKMTQAPAIERSNQFLPEVILLRQAIIGQESNANFRAVNRHSGALGYAQVMPSNLPKWSMEALGYVVSRKDFLNRPDLQIAIVDYKLNQYWQRSLMASKGNQALAIRRVAAWWYSGKPETYRSNRPQFYKGHRYPSIAAYTQSVLKRYLNLANSGNAALLRSNSSQGRGS